MDELHGIHQKALTQFNKIQEAEHYERQQCVDDRRFYSLSGAQWEGRLQQQFANKPRYEINKIKMSIMRIISEYRNNRISVDFKNKDGAEDDELADLFDGLYRACEQDSSADEAYDNAFEEGVGGGIGAWRLSTQYVNEYDPENEHQKVVIEPIYDADTCVFFDPKAKRQDKRDADYCFVLNGMSREEYEEEYGDDVTEWPRPTDVRNFDWATKDMVYVAEYYCAKKTKEKVYLYESLTGEKQSFFESDFEADQDLERRLLAEGATLLNERTIKRRRIKKYIMSYASILEDCGYIPGTEIPIVPFYGKRWYVDGQERAEGHVRPAKDVQRLLNISTSYLVDILSYSAIEKPILTPEQVHGFQEYWENDNVKNYSYMLLNPITGPDGSPVATGPVGYTKPPQIPPAMSALIQLTDADIKELLGNPEAAEKVVSNISGKAINLIQQRLDMPTYIYMSNFAKSMRRSGEIFLSMSKEIYVEQGRKLKTVGIDKKSSSIVIKNPITDQDTGKIEYENDLARAHLSVFSSVGPRSETKKESTLKSLLEMMSVAPDDESKTILSGLALMNIDGEGIDDAKSYFRNRLIRAGVVEPNQAELEEMAIEAENAQPDPQAQLLQAAAAAENAKAVKSRADTVYTLARAKEAEAETAKTLSEVQASEVEQTLELLDRLRSGNPPQQPNNEAL